MNELDILNFYNNWWLTEKVPSQLLQKYQRNLYRSLLLNLPYEEYNRILSILGPRRTGKTTLLYQLISYLLIKKIDPKRILFLSISDPVFAENQDFLERCITLYTEVVLKETLSKLREPVYFFLDEIQYLKNWELWIKRYYDLKFKIKFIISGSASSLIIKKGRESLAGRIREESLLPMSFDEYLGLRRVINENDKSDESYLLMDKFNLFDFQDGYFDLKRYKSFESFGRRLLEKESEIASRNILASSLLKDYMLKGGFPEVYREKDLNTIYLHLNQDVLERVTALDIPQIAEVTDIRLLQSLFLQIASRSGSIFSYRNIAADSGVRSETVRNYLLYLSSAFLTGELWQFRKAEIARLRANKKFYICDVGLRHAVLKYSLGTIYSLSEKGIDAETIVFNHLRNSEKNMSFWRKGDQEVDFVIDSYGFVIPVEVKFKKTIRKDDLSGIRKFINYYKLSGGIVVTESTLSCKDGLVFIPLWLFLLINP